MAFGAEVEAKIESLAILSNRKNRVNSNGTLQTRWSW